MSRGKQDTKQLIVKATLGLLKEVGMEGLTMRQVAAAAGLSLGNLQYHFKTKRLLLDYTARHYFNECDSVLDDSLDPGVRVAEPEVIRAFIATILEEAERLSDACLIFRAMWAVSVRDPSVEKQLTEYYRQLSARVVAFWSPCGEDRAKRATALLLPYLDGYSISYQALPLDREGVVDVLTRAVCDILLP